MKHISVCKFILTVFCVFSLLGGGCASQKQQIKKDRSGATVPGTTVPGTTVPGTTGPVDNAQEKIRPDHDYTVKPAAKSAVKPPNKVYTSPDGKFEYVQTPFGIVKRRAKKFGQNKQTPKPDAKTATGAKTAPGTAVPAEKPAPKKELSTVYDTAVADPAAGEKQKPGADIPGHIVLNFDGADLEEVVRTLAEILKINYIIEPNIRGKVTIHSAGKLKHTDLFPVFFQILEINGLTAVKEGNLYKIIKMKNASQMPVALRLKTGYGDLPPGQRVIIQVIKLNHISTQEITKLITPFISSEGSIISHEDLKTLLIVDKGINILKILKLIDLAKIFNLIVWQTETYCIT